METADYFREKAAQCRRLAAGIGNQRDPIVANLLALAVEFEARAVALAAEQAAETQIELSAPDEGSETPVKKRRGRGRGPSRR
jgi:hypothetical protein